MQLLVTVWAPAALYASTHNESTAEECTCDHPTGGVCPMHRHSSSSPSPSGGCVIRGAIDPMDGLVASLIGPTGVLPAVVVSIDPIETSDPVVSVERAPIDSADSSGLSSTARLALPRFRRLYRSLAIRLLEAVRRDRVGSFQCRNQRDIWGMVHASQHFGVSRGRLRVDGTRSNGCRTGDRQFRQREWEGH